MRLRALCLVIGGSLILGGTSLGASAVPSGNKEGLAFADWMFPTDTADRYRWLGAWLHRRENVATGKVTVYGGVVKGTCVKQKRGDAVGMVCRGSGRGIDHDDLFEISPDASGARLELRQGRFRHRVVWRAERDMPGVYESYEACSDREGNEGEGHGGGVVRPATASGRVFGQRVETDAESRWDWTSIWSGASLSECDFGISRAELNDLLDGGSVSITRSF